MLLTSLPLTQTPFHQCLEQMNMKPHRPLGSTLIPTYVSLILKQRLDCCLIDYIMFGCWSVVDDDVIECQSIFLEHHQRGLFPKISVSYRKL